MDNPLGPALFAMIGIWSLVGLAFYLWYLWALSRLFPRIGLPSGWGWIPVWNQWQLVQRTGLPGWIVLLGFVPLLGIVVWVVSIIAVHRLNTEYGKGPGYTVIGAVLPPIWAMLLANAIDDQNAAYHGQDPRFGGVNTAQPQAGYPQAGQQPAAPGQPYAGQQPGAGQPTPVAPGQQAPGHPQQPAAPAQTWAPQPYAAPGQPPQQVAPGQPPQPVAPGQEPSQYATPGYSTPADLAWSQQPAAPQQAPAPQDPASAENDWGFSKTTEGAYERLAAEGAPPRQFGTGALNAPAPQQPFSWPEPQPVPAHSGTPTPAEPLVLPTPEGPQNQAAPAEAYPQQQGESWPQQPWQPGQPGQPAPAVNEAAPPAQPEPYAQSQDPAQHVQPEPYVQPVPPQYAQPQDPAQPVQPYAQPTVPGEAVPETPADPAQPAPPVAAEAPAAPPVDVFAPTPHAAEPSAAHGEHPAEEPEPSIFDRGSATPPVEAVAAPLGARTAPDEVAPAAPGVPDSVSATGLAGDATGAETSTPDPAEAADDPISTSGIPVGDDSDRTIVVQRPARWGIELPDGDVLELRGDDVIIGRKPSAEGKAVALQIPDPTRTVSKSHVRMRRAGEDWTLEDLHSTNGVATIDGGEPETIEAGREVPATEEFIIGTLQVRLAKLS